jgi:thiamine biosynthesis protein ThiS
MKLVINGQTQEIADARTIRELVQTLHLAPQTLLVEHNGLALRPHEWPERRLDEGDCIEILKVVAGG